MKLRLIFFLGVLSFAHQSVAQTFHSLPPGFSFQTRALCYDDSTNLLYIGGNFSTLYDGTPMRAISVWNGNIWDSLDFGILGYVFTLAKYKGEIYAGGNFISAGTVLSKSLAKWDGNSWYTIGNINNTPSYSTVLCLKELQNELYVLGNFDSINNTLANGISKYDGQNWFAFPTLDPNGYFNACAIFNNELYVGGNFDGGPGLKDIAKFDGTSWVSVGGGLSGSASNVGDMKIFQNKLYIVGNLSASAGDHGNGIAIWDGNVWSQASTGLLPGTIMALHEFQGELYAGGQIFNAGGVPVTYIAKWDGLNWYSLGGVFDNGVGAFASNGPDLYISGGFRTINGDSVNFVARYTNYVGLEEFTDLTNSMFNIYPNPATEYLTITAVNNGEEKRVNIYEITGRLVKNEIFNAEEEIQMDLIDFAPGVYMISIETLTNHEMKKLVVAR